ncbi:peptidase inhibitor family I36 [Stackebrandtia albiflava]|uniref:Peptidase inhibitor family I36 n=1 Tax=Stackebrandtia albiflava TaxID=406432 RepID=A0A562V576_9ACTN|nr:peptidase inhibitor family I36 protein [Stackebrandtia albiflava]TWJ12982.1 peptidase inhibitor family I36 [Stackebrandtia albiflava]
MNTIRFARAAAVAAGVAAVALSSAATAQAAPAEQLPPGVIALNDGEGCPPMTFCLYRDYRGEGPAYGIAEGYNVNLHEFGMGNTVSTWINNTTMTALVVDADTMHHQVVEAGQWMEESQETNDTADWVVWTH